MVTPLTLQDALNRFLTEHVARDILLKTTTTDGQTVATTRPHVLPGFILPRRSKHPSQSNAGEFPYIITRVTDVKNAEPTKHGTFGCIATVKILFGAYCPGTYAGDTPINDGSGYRDIWNMMEKTRQALFSQKILDKKYMIMDAPFSCEMPDEQPYPYWEGWITTSWHVCYQPPQGLGVE